MSLQPEEQLNEGEDVDQDVIGKYEGMRNQDNQRHGLGCALLPNGDMYDGQYKFGKRHGRGIYIFRNGARYHGTYRQGMKHGIGKFIYPDGSTYEGEWKKDDKHGYGLYKYPNGDYYEGSWYKGKRHGHGSYFHKKDGVKYSGYWVEGKRQGTAQVHYAKFRHHGTWKDNRPIGEGCFTFDTKAIQLGHHLYIDEKHKNFVSDEDGWPAENDEEEGKEEAREKVKEEATKDRKRDGEKGDDVEGEEGAEEEEDTADKQKTLFWIPEEYIAFSADKIPAETLVPPKTPSDDIPAGEAGFDDDSDEVSNVDLLPGDDDDDFDYGGYDIPEYLNYFLDEKLRAQIEFNRESTDVYDETKGRQGSKQLSELDKMRNIICGNDELQDTEEDVNQYESRKSRESKRASINTSIPQNQSVTTQKQQFFSREQNKNSVLFSTFSFNFLTIN